MKNALTVDLEDWYHICGVEGCEDHRQWETYESRVIRNTQKILALLQKYKIKATFFVLGYIAAKEPALIKKIHSLGHEIATHGFYHRRIFEMTEQEFEADVARSLSAITSITGEKVAGYRAPEWSIRKNTLWALDILKKLNIIYDASMVPMTWMGDRDFPAYPCSLKTGFGEIWEFPLSTSRLLWERVPFSGGLPLRIAPYFFIVSAIRRINAQGHPAIIYLHPWEFDSEQPRIDLPWSRKFMHYFNIKAAPGKVEGLLQNFKFAPVREVLGLS